MKIRVAAGDFETTDNPNKTEVHTWQVCHITKHGAIVPTPLHQIDTREINGRTYHTGAGIETFILLLCYIKVSGLRLYFHNLSKFDGYFILIALIKSHHNPKSPISWVPGNDFVEENLGEYPYKVAQERMQKLRQVYANHLARIKDPEKQHKFLKWRYRYLLPGEFSFMMDGNHKITRISFCPIRQKIKKNGKYRVVSLLCSKLLFPRTSIASLGENLNRQFKTEKYTKGELIKREQKYPSLAALMGDTEVIKYITQDTTILSHYEDEVSKVIPRYKLQMTAAKTSYDELMRFIGVKRAAEFSFSTDELNEKTGYTKYFKMGDRSNRLYTPQQVGEQVVREKLPTGWLYNMYDGVLPWHQHIHEHYYRGGHNWLNEDKRGIPFTGSQLDIVSCYSSVMASDEPVPVGEPYDDGNKTYGDGGDEYPFKLRKVRVRRPIHNEHWIPFAVAENLEKRQFPRTLNIDDELYFLETEWEQFLESYNVDEKRDIQVTVELSFKTEPASWFFKEYVDHYFKLKTEAKNKGNYIETQMFKLYLNSPYGKFSSKVRRNTRDLASPGTEAVFGDIREYNTKNSYYLPLGATITAMARMRLVRAAGKQGKLVKYSDTDSFTINAPSKDIPRLFPNLKMGSGLGQFEWVKGTDRLLKDVTFVMRHTKQYAAFDENGKVITFKYAGLDASQSSISVDGEHPSTPEDLAIIDTITLRDMYFGKEFPNQIAPSRVEGGIYLDDDIKKHITPIHELPKLKDRIHFRTELETRLYWENNNLKDIFKKGRLKGKITK